ncbi:competence protein CglB [Streptococcus panodentis]|uniref:Competence protein CglB n=1 Tax=Streptococcus panodentis TaxID=1581472 RepID=A0ABS5AVA6_9STRE|nr:competence protein CglB [Streptococcus panodentis]
MLSRGRPKRLSTPKQKKVIELFYNLFSSGFHLAEIIDFLRRSALLEEAYVRQMQAGLAAGQSFSQIVSRLGFSDSVVTQLSLSELHGNLTLSLGKIGHYLDNLSKVRKKLIEVGTYPLLLLGFLVLIMLGLRNYLLPQLDRQNLATQFISQLPQFFLGGSLLLLLLLTGAYVYYRKAAPIAFFSRLARLPFAGSLLRAYLTAYYAREWGNMIGQGLELSQIFAVMQEQPSRLFQEVGKDMTAALEAGQAYADKVSSYPFFKKELALMIEYGEVKSKLGSELEVYAEKTWEEFFLRINRAMNLIQPLVFVFVALVIVLLYAAMLLPIYQNMEVSL